MWLAALLLICASGADSSVTTATGGASNTACAAISASSASQVKANPSAAPIVDAAIAYSCLNSVPLHRADALKLIADIVPYVEWQTTTSYLKNPPTGYQSPAVDLDAEFDVIQAKIKNGTYGNEYQFQADLFRVFNLAHDNHFRFLPDLLAGALNFQRDIGLVSVSLDGHSIPEIYTYEDIKSYVNGSNQVSAVKSINGQEGVKYIEELSQLGNLQDPDASYNSMFYSKPFNVFAPGWNGYFAGGGQFGFIFPGLNTTMGFKNGTTRTWATYSTVIGDFTGVVDGDSFYAKFCSGKPGAIEAPLPSSLPARPSSTLYTPAASPTVPGYPKPIITASDNAISGYYLTGKNSDVIVLSMLLMEDGTPAEFQAVIEDFFAAAKKAGKKKLIIDLSANSGGYILQGYDAFRQLFPQIVQDGYTRYRSSQAFRAIAAQYEGALKNIDSDKATWEEVYAVMSTANWKFDYNITNQPFPSEPSKVGPYVYNSDSFTDIIRWNPDDPLITTDPTFGLGMEITGYGDRQNFTQPWAAEDIVVLYDGFCSSTCTIFSEFLRTQGGVKSIAIGGRPSTAGMQALGGVKGAESGGVSFIYVLAQVAYNSLSATGKNSSSARTMKELSLYPYYRSVDNSFNLRDNILPANLEDQIPAQFLYEKADCRIFYQPSMITDMTSMWDMAASVAWGNGSCVEGGLNLPKRTVALDHDDLGLLDQVSLPARDFPVMQKNAFWKAVHGQRVPL